MQANCQAIFIKNWLLFWIIMKLCPNIINTNEPPQMFQKIFDNFQKSNRGMMILEYMLLIT